MSAEIKEYIESLDYNADKILEVRTEGDKEREELSYDEESGKTFKTTRVEHSLTQNLSKLPILGSLEGVIFPGNLVRADSKLVNGTPSAMTHQDRSKCTLTMNLPMGQTSSQVYPSVKGVHDFIQANEKAWFESKGGSVEPGVLDITCTEAFTKEQVSFRLKLKGQMGGDSLSSLLSVARDSEKRVLFACVRQEFYSVLVDQPKSPEKWFADSLSIADAKSAFSSESPPAYIGQVGYGRLTVIKMETDNKYNAYDMETSMNYMIKGGKVDGEFEAKYNSIKENASFSLVAFGGGAQGAIKDNLLATVGDACNWVDTVREEVFVGWRNKGAFTARFTVVYKQHPDGPDGPDHKVKTEWVPAGGRTGKFSLGNAYDIHVKVDMMYFINQWKCICHKELSSPNNKYLTAWGTTVVPQCGWEDS
ncbi:hypothetical protein THAOC_32315 [Thalassiosira oceanica]|uniref:Uncharacterized protein n=1 Tax=Thalassiosira oceanica TaxID=159749 RepID=K0R7G0_THAOC|nr:hypothetical protein THAOC_32315 [Thalassiosira oceanica]|eukprot:EJK48855.1 hypothetical protein THAOC_32315 [Thalassiosira oceanica]